MVPLRRASYVLSCLSGQQVAIKFVLGFYQQSHVELNIVTYPSLNLLTLGFAVYFLSFRAVGLLSLQRHHRAF